MHEPDNMKRDRLRRIALLILDAGNPAHTLRPEILEMLELLQAPAAPQGDISTGETRTAGGLALSPMMAAMCAEDYVRTIQFIRGTQAAIADIRKQFPGRPARILYAGCGPCATLAIPLMAVFSASEACFTLLDLHAGSIESAKSTVEKLGLAECVDRYEVTDAMDYRLAPNLPDIILMEIMQACLESEPQVAVARHLLPQAPDAIIIPEEVSIELVLVDPSREFDLAGSGKLERNRISLGSVFTLNREKVDSWAGNPENRLPAATVHLPDPIGPEHQPMLSTHIRVYKNHVLEDYDSGLTCPRILATETKPGNILHFHYEQGSNPRLCCAACEPTE